ncbi:MAG TPA: phosphoglycerate mutase family protein [Vicinamibacterales bacterium]|nr:phosphoglycerate mutase family protein [Vicinamibacterales bacterium]
MFRKHLVALLTAITLAVPAAAMAQRLVYVVRHAERADGGMPPAGVAKPDPPLSEAGKARADKLASMLAISGVTAIYVTEYVRTQQTAAPLAAALKLRPAVIPSSGTADLVARLKADHRNDIVLVVGHSNSVPEIIKALGGPPVTIADDEYDKLFIVVPATGAMTVIKY